MYRIGIITVSDKGSRGERVDRSGPAIREMVKELGEVVRYEVLPDDLDTLKEEMVNMSDKLKIDLILTTGGTGLSPRDNTPEATLAVIEREVPGLPEAMRQESLKKTKHAMLSRAVAGVRNRTELRKIATEFNVPPQVVGEVANNLKIKIKSCELGCF
jgi:molybdopterin adenylyltransferase